ncbi:unnamed protein product, partial [Vitis vinifera]|uniref:Uncharacterized protein n=1 Tax=Vitis vinifera TaxID=29760 RepID=D7UDP3_VITVI
MLIYYKIDKWLSFTLENKRLSFSAKGSIYPEQGLAKAGKSVGAPLAAWATEIPPLPASPTHTRKSGGPSTT